MLPECHNVSRETFCEIKLFGRPSRHWAYDFLYCGVGGYHRLKETPVSRRQWGEDVRPRMGNDLSILLFGSFVISHFALALFNSLWINKVVPISVGVPRMTYKAKIIALHHQFPTWTTSQITDAVGCHPSIVRQARFVLRLSIPHSRAGFSRKRGTLIVRPSIEAMLSSPG